MVFEDDQYFPPPFLKGHFSAKGNDKITFSFNPGSFFTHPIRASFATRFSPPVSFESEVVAQFITRHPRFSSEVPFPSVKAVRAISGSTLIVPEPSTNILPPTFIKDLSESTVFNILFGIGIPDNDFLPSLDFKDFCTFKSEGPPIFKKLLSSITEKYKRLASLDKEKDSVNNQFYNRLIKHRDNENKGVLIFAGCWRNFSSLSLAKSLAPSTKLSFLVLDFAHPLSNVRNVRELNPMTSGSIGDSSFSASYFFSSEVCLGEKDMGGDVHFGFAYNSHHLILSVVRKESKSDHSSTMFHSLAVVDPQDYSPFEVKETGSEIHQEDFVIATFLKGSKEIDAIAKAGFYCRKIPDLANSWNAFDVYQIYAIHDCVSCDTIRSFLLSKSQSVTSSTIGIGMIDSQTVSLVAE